MQRIRSLDWEAIAGIVAAVVALVLHLLHIAEEGVLLAVILVLMALLLLRDLRRESREDRQAQLLETEARNLSELRGLLKTPDILLVGPRDLRAASEQFSRRARGEMTWYNVCLLMFVPQDLFDSLLRPAIENENVSAIQFVLNRTEQEAWVQAVVPKLARIPAAAKVREPRWASLTESTSFVLAENLQGQKEALLSFWGEPFMAHTPGGDLPRYVLHVLPQSELIARLEDLAREARLLA